MVRGEGEGDEEGGDEKGREGESVEYQLWMPPITMPQDIRRVQSCLKEYCEHVHIPTYACNNDVEGPPTLRSIFYLLRSMSYIVNGLHHHLCITNRTLSRT